jgi:hypothetical protein
MKSLPSELWNSPVIKKRLFAEACFECDWGISHKKFYWVMVPHADSKDGVITLLNYEQSVINDDPQDIQKRFARKLMVELQRKMHHDGLWIVGFTHPPYRTTHEIITDTGDNCWNRLFAIWLDADGDPQYTFESDLPFVQQIEGGDDKAVERYMGLAAKSHQQWKEIYGPMAMKRDMMLKEGQSRRAALEALR